MATYKRQRYLFMTTDPVHIGTGGYRLGRVDNSIVRDPGTRVPKIPGTSLHGAARSYAAQLFENPAAAGQDQKGVADPGADPVCYTFGYLETDRSQGDKVVGFSGVVNIFDAHILLFPVHSRIGPIWVSTLERLQEAGIVVDDVPDSWALDTGLPTWQHSDNLNLGWLMVGVGNKIALTVPDEWQVDRNWRVVAERIIVVSSGLFSQIVNSNLEVRTSVAIDPERGAAEGKALFTYEALPRTTFLTADVILDDYRDGGGQRPFPKNLTSRGNPLPGPEWLGPLDVVRAGLRMIGWLGVGGMGTRGFGRMKIVGEPLIRELSEEGW